MHFPILQSRCFFWLVFMLVVTAVCSARPKKDVVQFANGDRMTCEIIKLEKGYLYVSLDYADGTVALDWTKIARIESDQSFVVTDRHGIRRTGRLHSMSKESTQPELSIQVVQASEVHTLTGEDTVAVNQTENRFLQNLHGGINVGFNFTKQQDQAQYSLDSNVTYSRPRWSADAYYDSSFTGGGDVSSLRSDLRLSSSRQLRSPDNFYRGTAEFLHNGEQELDLRTTLGGAVGHNFLHTNNSIIGTYGGLVWNRERYSSLAAASDSEDSAEGVMGTQLNFFRFKTTNLFADARVYPSLTNPGRTRFDLNSSFKLKIAKDLYWQFSYYLNTDSRPPRDLPKTDYGSTSSLGWSF